MQRLEQRGAGVLWKAVKGDVHAMQNAPDRALKTDFQALAGNPQILKALQPQLTHLGLAEVMAIDH